MKKISIITAEQGKNLALAKKVSNAFDSENFDINFIDLIELDLPLFTIQRLNKYGISQNVHDLTAQITSSHGFVFIAPEYNGGVPPVLTNAIAWITVSTKDWRDCFNKKIAGIGTYSGGGGMQLIMNLRGQLSYLGLTVIGLPLYTNQSIELKNDDLTSFVSQIQGLV